MLGPMGGTVGTEADGRHLRRTRNREAVLDAVIEIFEEGIVDPAMDDVAARAGVSNRSIYRYFEHRDHVIRAAVTYAMRRVTDEITFGDASHGDFDERVARFVDHRLSVYERLAPITRAAKVAAATEPIVAEEFEVGRFMLRQQFLDQFGPELSPLRPREQTRAVIAAEVAFQFDAFEFLWTAMDAQLGEIRELLVDHLNLTLGRLRTPQP